MSVFRPVDPKQSLPELEARILALWREHRIFDKSLAERNPDGTQRPVFLFYEGPPTANGLPGIHHVLSRAFKDVIPRYKTMRGYRVPRKAGWDTHGLPVEVEVEKHLGLRGKQEIEQLGVEEFNRCCRQSVFRYIEDWNRLTERIGFWLDTNDPYRTLDNSYIESCWALLKRLWQRGLLQQDYKVTKHCPRCGTSLAEAEAGQGMKEDVDDPSLTVRLRLRPGQPLPMGGRSTDELSTSVLIWTTTPWTLPANAAAALHPEAPYALCEVQGPAGRERLLLLAERVQAMLGSEVTVLGEAPGAALAGLRYEPLYPGVGPGGQEVDLSAAYRLVADATVELGEGTGVVHIAPAYGDLDVGRRHGLPVLFSVGLDGMVLPAFSDFAGRFFKDADPIITRDLRQRGLLLSAGRTRHSYPFCWRCDTPLLYYAKTSWYIRTTAVKEQMLRANQSICWYPEHIRDGRFGDWLRNNVDWALSRERYWGTPLPLWQCDRCETWECIGSIAELSARVGQDLSQKPDLDLHRPQVDGWTWTCAAPGCGGTMRRSRDVIDCWFDSGAMPFAQHHWPFAHGDSLEGIFPAEFISEGVDQTRGWFYTLHALGVLIAGGPAFRHCIALGHILDDQGRKMSKRLGNVVDPWTVLDAEGADALRYYLYTASPPGQPRRFSQALVRQSLRQFLLTLWNCYSFYVTYAEVELDRLERAEVPVAERPVIDQWILGRLHRLIEEMTALLDRYDITGAARALGGFVEELSNWYVRRTRDRFWSSLEGAALDSPVERDKRAAYQTLHACLMGVAQLGAPFIPFVTEEIWQNLVRPLQPDAPQSVHLSRWPTPDRALIEQTAELVADMEVVLRVVALGRAARLEAGLRTRQPLQAVLVQLPGAAARRALSRFEREVREELNVEEVRILQEGAHLLSYTLRPNLPLLGKKYGRRLRSIQQALAAGSEAERQRWAEAVLRQEPVRLTTDEGEVELLPEEVLLTSQSLQGVAARAEGGLVVGLTTEITPQLRDRGTAREIVRAIGELRKQAGCRVSDRVHIGWTAPPGQVHDAILRHAAHIASETLAELHEAPLPEPDAHGEVDLDGTVVALTLRR